VSEYLVLIRYNVVFTYRKIKTLGESDSDEDAATWVRKNRMKQREKDRADKTVQKIMLYLYIKIEIG